MSRRQLLILTSLFVALLMGGTYYALTRSGFTRDFVRDRIAEVLHGVRIESATMDPFGGTVRIEDVRVSARGSRTETDPTPREVLRADEVVVGVSLNPLTGVGELRTVTIERPVLDLHLGENEAIDLSSLLVQEIGGGATLGPNAFPAIEIRNMTVRLHLTDRDPRPIVLEDIQLSVRREEGDDKRVAIVGRCRNPFGGEIRIRGSGDVEKREFRLLSESESFFVGEDELRRFGPDALAFARRHQVSGRVTPTLWLSYPSPEGGLAVGAHAQFEDCTFLPPTYAYKLEHMRGRAALSPENGGTLILECAREGTDGKLRGRLKMTEIDTANVIELNVHGEQLLLVPELRTAMDAQLQQVGAVWDAIQPDAGRFDLRMYVRSGDGVSREDQIVELDLDLHGISACYRGLPPESGEGPRIGFPLPLEDVHAQVRLRDRRVHMSELQARGPRGGRVRGEFELDLDTQAFDLLVAAEDLATTPQLREAFGATVPRGLELWDQFAPSGRCSVEFRGQRQRAGGEDDFDFVCKVHPDAMRAQWTRFPVPLAQLTGEIVATRDSVRFALGGLRPPETAVRMRGHVDLAALDGAAPERVERVTSDDLQWEVHVEAEGLELDAELRDALAVLRPALRERWEMFGPEGHCDVDFLGWKSGPDELDFDLRAELRHVSARFAAFPAPMHAIDGPVLLQGTKDGVRVEVMGLRGTSLGARLLFHGSLMTPQGREDELPLTDLTTIAQGAVLAEDLGELLIDQQMTTRQIWDMAEASGRIDATHHVRREQGDVGFAQTLELDLRDVRIDARILPDSLTNVSGSVRIDEQKIAHLDELRGFVGETEVRCRTGRIEQGPNDTRIELQLGTSDYPVDDRLARLLSGRPKEAYLSLGARGRVGFEDLTVRLRLPKGPGANATATTTGMEVWIDEANVLVRDLAFDAGVAFSNMRGNVRMTEGHFGPEGALFRGTFSGLAFETVGQPFEDGQGDFEMTHEAFTIPRGRVRLHRGSLGGVGAPGPDGRVPPVFHYRLSRPGTLTEAPVERKVFGHFDVQNVSLESLMREYDVGYRYKGRIGGRIDLEMEPDDRTSLQLTCGIAIDDADLGSVPVFTSIYAFLRPEKRPRFDHFLLHARTVDRSFEIEQLRLGSPLLKIDGRGRIDYDGYVHLTLQFPDLFPEADNAFILPGIYKVLSNMLVSFDIYGYFGMTRTGPRFLMEGAPDRAPLGPLPVKAPRIPELFK